MHTNKKLHIFLGILAFFMLFFLGFAHAVSSGAPSEPDVNIQENGIVRDGRCRFDMKVTFVGSCYEPRIGVRIGEILGGDIEVTEPKNLTVEDTFYDLEYSFPINNGYERTYTVKIGEVAYVEQDGQDCKIANAEFNKEFTTKCTPPATGTDTAGTNTNTTAQPCDDKKCTGEGEKCFKQGTGDVCVCVSDMDNPNPKKRVCCGVELLTDVPFIGKCIELRTAQEKSILKENGLLDVDSSTLTITEEEAFPRIMLGLTKILVTVILLASFGAIVVAGVMMAASGSDDTQANKGRQLIGSVIVGLALLGASGVILRLINPNFFG